jgi:hypothetical protein
VGEGSYQEAAGVRRLSCRPESTVLAAQLTARSACQSDHAETYFTPGMPSKCASCVQSVAPLELPE